ncbi:hypothetical protein FRC05_009039 [Tulasnella sp. 425]|nr:hypothetical protein FRC05_009039 [Tulasnella sp. 425]
MWRTAMFTTLLFMDESLLRIAKRSTDEGPLTVDEAVNGTGSANADREDRSQPPPPRRSQTITLLLDSAVAPVIFMGFCMSFLINAFTSTFVLWTYTPLRLGGLQREPAEIGLVISVIGTLGIAMSTMVFPYLHARFKSVPLFTACVGFWGVAYALIPLVEMIVRNVLQPTQPPEPAPPLKGLWGLVLCILVTQRIGSMAYPAYMLVVKEAMPDPAAVGTLFGLATAANCLGEGTAPAIASSLFALSVDRNLLGGNLVWIILIALAAFATWFARGLKSRVEGT